jgi:predicted alpha/beta-hydrolase family hydrolase
MGTHELPTPAGPALAEFDRPRGAKGLLVLTHGASGGAGTADLRAVRDAATGNGIAVALLTQPFAVAGRRTPPKPAAQDAAWLAALAELRKRKPVKDLPLIVGGRSNGARVACRTAVAAGAVGVVALAFPVHPPGRPQNTRIDELDGTGVPVLVVQGDRDAFGMPPPAPRREVVVVPGADHALRRDLATVTAAVVRFVTSVVASASVEA